MLRARAMPGRSCSLARSCSPAAWLGAEAPGDILSRLLLGLDAASLRRWSDEFVVPYRAYNFCGAGETNSPSPPRRPSLRRVAPRRGSLDSTPWNDGVKLQLGRRIEAGSGKLPRVRNHQRAGGFLKRSRFLFLWPPYARQSWRYTDPSAFGLPSQPLPPGLRQFHPPLLPS